MTSTIDISVAKEHLTDSQDNIAEALKTIHRVLKSYPILEQELVTATSHLKSARELMGLAGKRLPE